MNREDIIRMAREADRYASANHVQWIGPEVINMDWVVARDERFAALVAAAEQKKWEEQTPIEINEAVLEEREACAKVCEAYTDNDGGTFIDHEGHGYECAAAIRARGQE